MKKTFLSSLIFAAASMFVLTGCLKDKGFDNNEYGINDPDTQPPGVGFPLAAKAKNTYGLDVSASSQAVNGLVYVNLESGTPAPSDIVITLELDSNMVKSYNTANGTSIKIMNYSLFTMPGLAGSPARTTVTIPAGGRNVEIPINVPSTLSFDPNSTYGVGVKIVSVTGNYTIASNMKNLLIEFSIKNKYDGKYNLVGYHNRVPYDAPYDEIVHMITSGPSSVTMYWPAAATYAHPILGGASYYGSFTTNLIFNPSTNVLIDWNQYPYAFTVTNQVYSGSYDPVNKIIYAEIGYNGNVLRKFFDTMTYLGPR
ncbi:MAG: DUF1735 domain-containing protein [Chitinophagaceae bacterium]|nr:DUF1735 domain-containing protein [Chitinophagaceae bacterium]MBK8952405.1 DUF1735 domain-containing protein [Chitinophagaceae bacterium]